MPSSPERDYPHYIPLPPLRSAMKHPSRPCTPCSPPNRSSPLVPASSTVTPSPSGSPSTSTLLASPSATPPCVVTPLTPPSPLVAAQGYEPKVSFDTLENPQASMFSYTLHVQSEGYQRTRHTRVFLCASSPDEPGKTALDWALESLVQDGDELIVFRGVDTDELGAFIHRFDNTSLIIVRRQGPRPVSRGRTRADAVYPGEVFRRRPRSESAFSAPLANLLRADQSPDIALDHRRVYCG